MEDELENFDEDMLTERTRELIDTEITENQSSPRMKHKSNSMEKEIQRKASSKTGASWNKEEIEYLVRQRSNMDNEELENFLKGDHKAREEIANWERFSRTEEKFILQSAASLDVEDMAERLNRSEEEIEIQMRLMGLQNQISG